jgi:hypothetical protein
MRGTQGRYHTVLEGFLGDAVPFALEGSCIAIHRVTVARTFRATASARHGLSAPIVSDAEPVSADERKARNRQGSEKRQRHVMLTARVNPEEERRIREAARAKGMSVASLIRSAVLAAADGPVNAPVQYRAAGPCS